MAYSVVRAETVDVYVDSRGDLGRALRYFDSRDEAVAYAAEVATDYHYGVAIVDESCWEVEA